MYLRILNARGGFEGTGVVIAACTAAVILLGVHMGTPAWAQDGFQPIFNGKDLSGWDGDPDFWRVEDGAITGESTQENPLRRNTFIIWRQGGLDDFELRLEYRITAGNSGIQYRSWEEGGKWHVAGYQADIEAGGGLTGALFGEGGGGILAEKLEKDGHAAPAWGSHRGLLAACGEKTVVDESHKRQVKGSVGDREEVLSGLKEGGWNEYCIIARGRHLIQKVNGQVTVDVTDRDPVMVRKKGLLALQLHSGKPAKVQFRNIRLKRLPLAEGKKVVFLAGRKSHGYQGHEHNAGCLLLADCLDSNVPEVVTQVYLSASWTEDPTALDNADTVIMFSDGQGGHVARGHFEKIDELAEKGVGLACIHYAVEPQKNEEGHEHFLDWIGGFYEKEYSINPHWHAEFKEIPEHAVTRGVKPFGADDEWYYPMRYVEDMKNVTPILTALPPDETRMRPFGSHSGNPHVRKRKGMPEHVAWVYERPGGGRGFGFTGGHWHWNWANHGFRTTVLNAIVWTAGLEVPEGGVPSEKPTLEELKENQDYSEPGNYNWKRVTSLLEQW